jgi:hypothetical protein
MRLAFWKFMPNPAIDGLVTRTRISPSWKASSASAFASGVHLPSTLTAPSIASATAVGLVVEAAPDDPLLVAGGELGGALDARVHRLRRTLGAAADAAEVGREQLAGRLDGSASTISGTIRSGGRSQPSSG